jgi:ribosome maturation factor RimP
LETGGSPFFVFGKRQQTMMKSEANNSTAVEAINKPLLQQIEKQVIEEVNGIAGPLCRDEGLELVFIEFRREPHGRVLRVYVDKGGGITLDDCARISQQLGDILDATLEDIGPYRLEISSPGANRPLGRLQDYERFSGEKVHIKTHHPLNGRKNFRGILQGIDRGVVAVRCDNQEIFISIEDISIARLVNYNGEK